MSVVKTMKTATAANANSMEPTPFQQPTSASKNVAWKRSLSTAWMLAHREWIRFFRQPFRVIAALGQPILFWILFGTGLHGAFRGATPGEDFMTFFLPGTTALILLFTAIFATISIIEDRKEGFLQGVLVAPPARWSIVVGKALGGAAIAWAQAMVFLCLALAVGTLPMNSQWFLLVLFLFLSATAITSLGVCFAWPMDSTQGYHAAMNLVLLPMWLLSGAFFPIPLVTTDQPIGQWIFHWLMRCNPMTYIVGGIRHLIHGADKSTEINAMNATNIAPNTNLAPEGIANTAWVPELSTCVGVTCLFAIVAIAIATWMVQKRQKGETL